VTTIPANERRVAPGRRRILIGVLLALVGFGATLNPVTFTLLCAGVAYGSLWEFAKLAERKNAPLAFPVAFLAVSAYLLLTHLHWIHRFEGILLGATVIAALASTALSGRTSALSRGGYTLFAVLYIGKLTSYFITIHALPEIGPAASVAVIAMVVATDVFAMAIGIRFGRTPLSPLSPKKTVEGAIGGFVAAVAVGAFVAVTPIFHLALWQGMLVGALTSLAAQAGDLVESGLKRDANVKDAGTFIVGHGGVLDRFDSFLFAGIAFYFALYVIGAIPPGLFR
jgi:phosphatidate cytidylyltransferase